ncbi:MAG: diguanylate cyclase [Rhodospirillales bacterium]|jgi:diguanylate cyclase (GGDEF)-like protein|nr:diguanylate cyclase [Rhodospirillales bacterium]MBT5076765.1 diguanylate cyclase [Rhodospirillales bacterium]MBT5112718.1 diguanylate cyclase [Rhodospirillales bacterium]MBT5673488.1 diguanylate cyclase [Rhodospirillales bacterium]MBT6186147.1 diguanylate cyclase [Rhodospirillales bacterium]
MVEKRKSPKKRAPVKSRAKSGTKSARPEKTLCAHFGLTKKEIASRVDYFGLDGRQFQKDINELHQIIDPVIDEIVGDFYQHLKRFPIAHRFLAPKGMTRRLLKTLTDYLLTLGGDIHSTAYIDSRLKVGIIHEKIGLDQKWYLGAYGNLSAIITKHLAIEMAEHPKMNLPRLVATMDKVLMFDASLGIDTYHFESLSTSRTLLNQVQAAEAKLKEASRHDTLTGVYNRAAFLSLLDNEMQRFHRYDRPITVLFIDFDHFKNINDTQGHAFGDTVLMSAVKVIQGSIRGPDFVGRYGGEELVVTLVECGKEEGQKIAERIRENIANHKFQKRNSKISKKVTVSIGLYAPTRRQKNVGNILRHADRAMYVAKAKGRNRVVTYKTGISAKTP